MPESRWRDAERACYPSFRLHRAFYDPSKPLWRTLMRSGWFILALKLAQAAFATLLLVLVGGPRSASLALVVPETISIVSMPVPLQANAPERRRAGQLTLMAGWLLKSRSPQFGGWSGLHIEGDRVTAIGDYGSVLRFRLTPFGRAVDARIDPLPAGCGRQDDKRQRDSEALTAVPDGWWIGYESDNRLCKVTSDFSRALALRRPPSMARWDKRYGAEAILKLIDGRFLVFAERSPPGGVGRPLLVFAGDPAKVGTRVSIRRYVPPSGFSPTDAAQLPDGRILVLNRRFSFAGLFETIVTVVDTAQIESGAPVTSVPIARFSAPTLHDNFEGLAVTVEQGRPIIWMISDDNFLSWQGTYLLKFALDADPVTPKTGN